MTSPRHGLESISEFNYEDATVEGRRAALLDTRLKEIEKHAETRRRLLRDLYFTMTSQKDPASIVTISSPPLDDQSSEATMFVREWEISSNFQYKPIRMLNTDLPIETSPRSPSPVPESSSPDPLALRGAEEEDMDAEIPDQTETLTKEEAQIDATLDVARGESEEMVQERNREEALPVPDGEVEEVGMEFEPESPVELVLPDVKQEEEVAILPPALEELSSDIPPDMIAQERVFSDVEGEMDVEDDIPQSPPRRTFNDFSSFNPHFRHDSPAPERPNSPSRGDFVLDPHTTISNSVVDPLVTPYALSLYPLPPPPPKGKRKKEKEKFMKGLELYKWQATINHNPVSKWLRKASKCVSTKEWAVGFAERRFIKAITYVDILKKENRWSFRQPKRSKGPTLVKGHWDYLLDEMRWLQTDFREERKWKMATAFELAHSVLDWHNADAEERANMCVKWRPPEVEQDEGMEMHKNPQEPLQPEPRMESDLLPDQPDQTNAEDNFNTVVQLAADDEDTGDSMVGAGIDPSSVNAAETLNEMQAPEDEMVIKEEAPGVDLSAFRTAESADADDADGDADQDGEVEDAAEGEADDFKPESLLQDPDDHTRPTGKPTQQPNTQVPSSEQTRSHHLKSVRTSFLENVSANETIIDLTKLTESLSLIPSEQPNGLREHEPIKLPDLFPELATYGPFVSAADLRGRPDKRIEETTSLGKISYASRFLDVKPVLVSTLQPAKKRKFGEWDDLVEFFPADDTNQEIRPTEYYLPAPAPLFSGVRKPREYPSTRGVATHLTPEQAQARLNSQIWTPEEDAQLKHLAYIYSLNWSLIADAFGSWRKSAPTDKRSEWDCMIRWDRLYGPTAKQLQLQQQQQQQDAMAVDENQSIGARRGARSTQSRYRDPPQTPSVALQMMPPPSQPTGATPIKLSDLTKKQIRRGYMHEAIKRIAKKREVSMVKSAANNQVKSRALTNIHDTYAQSGHIFTPLELSAIKSERDRKSAQMLELRKQEQLRLAMQQQQRMGTAKIPVMMAPGPNQVAQIRNMQAAQLQQQQQRAQAAAVGQAVATNQQSPPLAPAMSRVPTVTQQAMLAQAQQQAQTQAQAQLTASAVLQAQSQAAASQASPPRPGSSASTTAAGGAQASPTSTLAAQHLIRAQVAAAANGANPLQPFDPSMLSGMTAEQIQAAMHHQMQLRLMMQQAQAHQQQQQQLFANANAQRAATATPVQGAVAGVGTPTQSDTQGSPAS
ncbi:chromatin modification- protein VID21 [Tulasnella sp. 403]|nr:chromatin modification- protein VID21 [Tulasnella sp. 403]